MTETVFYLWVFRCTNDEWPRAFLRTTVLIVRSQNSIRSFIIFYRRRPIIFDFQLLFSSFGIIRHIVVERRSVYYIKPRILNSSYYTDYCILYTSKHGRWPVHRFSLVFLLQALLFSFADIAYSNGNENVEAQRIEIGYNTVY